MAAESMVSKRPVFRITLALFFLASTVSTNTYFSVLFHKTFIFKEMNKQEDIKNEKFFTCTPQPGPLTPCTDLLAPNFARVLLWVVLVLTLFFNGFIILLSNRRNFVSCEEYPMPKSIYHERITIRKQPKLYRKYPKLFRRLANVDNFDIILCHLCLADLIVTIYLIIIVIYDAKSGGHFVIDAAWWQQSAYCRSAGFCLVLGLQLAFYTVFIATLERYLATMFPLNPEKHFKRPVLFLAFCTSWVLSIASAVVTLYSNNDVTSVQVSAPLSSFNGAMCLPWLTDFSYIVILVGIHISAGCVMVVLCALLYCTRQKKSWLSAQKNTRLQISLIASGNILCILPLALLGLLASAIISYPSESQWGQLLGKDELTEATELNVNLMLVIAMLLICLRLIIDPILYVSFNKQFRCDFMQMIKTVFCFDKGKPEAQGYKNANSKEESTSIENTGPYLEDRNYLANLHSNSEMLRSFSFRIAPASNECCEQLIYRQNSKISERNFVSHDEEDEELTSEQQQFLFYSSDESDIYEGDVEDEASDDYQNVDVHVDPLEDLFDSLIQSNDPNPGENQFQKHADGKTVVKISDDIAKPETSNLNIISRSKPKWNAIKDRKREAKQLVWQKEDRSISVANGQMISHSGESSTSKDSGIQSEPDFGAIAPCSSTTSSLSRSSKQNRKLANILPLRLNHLEIAPRNKQTAGEPDSPLKDADVCFPILQPANQSGNRPTYFILSQTVPRQKTLIKYETTL